MIGHRLVWSSPIIPSCFDNVHRHTKLQNAFCCWLSLTNWIFHSEYFCWDVPDSKIWINIKALRATVCLYASLGSWGYVLLGSSTQPVQVFHCGIKLTCVGIKVGMCFFSAMIYHPAIWFSYIRLEIYRHFIYEDEVGHHLFQVH